MPRVWLVNVEEVACADDAEYDSLWVPAVTGVYCVRFLFCLEPGDLLISPVAIPEGFLAYVRRVLGRPDTDAMVLLLERRSRPYGLAASVLEDRGLRDRLARLGRAGGWVLEPYVESRRVVELSKATGLPTDKTHPDFILNGTILKLNDKGYFRDLASRLGVPVMPGRLARDRASIEAALEEVGREAPGRLFLKKTRYGGGMGNLCGTREELLARLPSWYNQGEVLVEPALDFESIAGTLMTLGHDCVRFWGVDLQHIDAHHWAGFDYPHPDQEASALLCGLSLKLANAVHRKRARGDLNLDWGLLREGSGGLRPVLLECNFRHNGFGHILRFSRMYFGSRAQNLSTRFFLGFRLRDQGLGMEGLLGALRGLCDSGEPLLIESPGRARGVVVMAAPADGVCALAVFADSAGYLSRAETLLREALA